jgi:glycosyltransferase involved in cell wall biosynthesis
MSRNPRNLRSPTRSGIVFVSSMTHEPWGGSEELWSRTAIALAKKGIPVGASVQHWPTRHKAVVKLMEHGVVANLRGKPAGLWERGLRMAIPHFGGQSTRDLDRFITAQTPALIVLSSGIAVPPLEYIELCVEGNWPFVTIGQSNYDQWWPPDSLADRYRKCLARAERCYFVADANRRLVERQLGHDFVNAELVRNPFNVPPDASPSWPPLTETGVLKLACVARLFPPSKGQDILLEALSEAPWTDREWSLTFYGDGAHRGTLERLVTRFRLTNRVFFAGFVQDVEEVWSRNHVLVIASRAEGLPLAMVEAMMCSRPIIATDIAGHSEIVDHGVTGFLAKAPTVDAFRAALEQAWQGRSTLWKMGQDAGRQIRKLIPADPVQVFSQKILSVCRSLSNRPQGSTLQMMVVPD